VAERRELLAPDQAGRLDRWLADVLPLSRSRIQALVRDGLVEVDGRCVRPSMKLVGGERVMVEMPVMATTKAIAQDIPIEICHIDPHLLVVVKPAGMVVHPSKGHPDQTLVNAVLHHIEAAEGPNPGDPFRPGIVHRIDKGTSGLLVVARTSVAMAGLAEQFAEHTVHRRYLALVWGTPTPAIDTIDAAVARHPKDRVRFAVVDGGKRAVTHYRVHGTSRPSRTGSGGDVSLISCRLETGRTHQIRVHLEHRGHPLVADPVYGAKLSRPSAWSPLLADLNHQMLHAARLGFVHPVTDRYLEFSAPLPEDYRGLLSVLGLSEDGLLV